MHIHESGSITYCTKCCWKRIITTKEENDDILHEDSICWCEKHIKKHKTLNVVVCRTYNTISHECDLCSFNSNNKSRIKHIYSYAKDDEIDYEQFYECPIKEKETKIQYISHSIHCKNCDKISHLCHTIALLWLCYNCKKYQIRLFSSPKNYIHIDNMKLFDVFSVVTWRCSLCFCINVSLFNDSSKQTVKFYCTYCNH